MGIFGNILRKSANSSKPPANPKKYMVAVLVVAALFVAIALDINSNARKSIEQFKNRQNKLTVHGEPQAKGKTPPDNGNIYRLNNATDTQIQTIKTMIDAKKDAILNQQWQMINYLVNNRPDLYNAMLPEVSRNIDVYNALTVKLSSLESRSSSTSIQQTSKSPGQKNDLDSINQLLQTNTPANNNH